MALLKMASIHRAYSDSQPQEIMPLTSETMSSKFLRQNS